MTESYQRKHKVITLGRGEPFTGSGKNESSEYQAQRGEDFSIAGQSFRVSQSQTWT